MAEEVHRLINKVINNISRVGYGLIFSLVRTLFPETLRNSKNIETNNGGNSGNNIKIMKSSFL